MKRFKNRLYELCTGKGKRCDLNADFQVITPPITQSNILFIW